MPARKQCLAAVGAALFFFLLASFAMAGDAPAARRVKVLFLGDRGIHAPVERCRLLFIPMAERGIDLTYTENVGDLNPATLGKYDGLLLYANITKISPEQEQALLDYVESGHGFIPIHSASACFGSSPKIVALIGGRFDHHSTGVFHETIVEAEHPIEKGLKAVESWDETYAHKDFNAKNEILAYRIEGEHKEPWTWVRSEGKGRVFYTAWGHDERTWTNANFVNLIERGIRWACGDWAMQGAPVLKPFDYVAADVPNYRPDVPRNETGATRMQMQQPVTPEESIRHMVLPPGFEAKLVAGDPQIHKPICMNWDERGRLWIAQTVDYPNAKQPLWQGHDQITICESTKGDGVADKLTTFCDGLSIPTSICFANGGAIVAQAPEMLFLKDTKGTGQADEKKVLFTGWGVSDTHAGPSNLHWGFDGWIYGTVGYSGFHGTVGGEERSFGAGGFRFKPDGSKLEFLGSSNNNTWGYGITEDNQGFISTANGNPSFYISIPNRFYEQIEGFSPKRPVTIADTPKFFPVCSKIRQVDYFGGYTAGAGCEIYTARSLPKEYWNRIAFVAEPTGHLVGQFALEPAGGTFVGRNDFSLMGSDDEWTAPIAAATGPDGAVWMIDWYSYIVQHNPIPKGFQKGSGGAYVTALRDKTHGRIYRLIYSGGKPSASMNLAGATPEQLVAALKSENLFWRMHAQRLLVERGNKDVAPALIQLAGDGSVDEIGLNPAAIHALWALHELGVLDGSDAAATAAAVQNLKHASAGVRRAALDVLPRTEASVQAILAGKLLEDADAQVRKSALLAMAEMPPSDAAGAAAFATLMRKENGSDLALADAGAIAGAHHDAGFLKAALGAEELKNLSGQVKFARVNVIPNPSFEEAAGAKPKVWTVRHWGGTSTEEYAAEAHTGKHSVKVSSTIGADTSWTVEIPCDPHTDYTLSGWIKTENVETIGKAAGALFNLHGTGFKSRAVKGTSDWRRMEIAFNSGTHNSLTVNCLFGGFGQAKGTAWFDDIELTPAQATALTSGSGRVVGLVVRHYAQRGPVDSLGSTLAALTKANPGLAAIVIDGLATGWPPEQAPKLSPEDVASLQTLYKQIPGEARDRLFSLAERWNRRDLFTGESAAVTKDLLALLANAAGDSGQRVAAARRLIALADSAANVDATVQQISAAAPPDLQLGLIDALAASAEPGVGASLVKRWKSLAPGAQDAAGALLLRRPAWTQALLDGLQAGDVGNRDLKNEQWAALVGYPDPQMAEQAKKLQKAAGRASSDDRQQIAEKLMHLATEKGDAKLGQQVFQKNCMVCHTLNGDGGKVGPELTGIGIRPKGENLIDIVDPNKSVEGTYREWIAKTKNEVISGRLFAETQTSVDIIDTGGIHHTVLRKEIKTLTTSNRSVMPEGFETLPPEELSGLLEFLAEHAATPKK